MGLDISKNFDLEETNFNKLMVKIRGMLLFWAKFNLSIVNIAKTYLLSQIGNKIGSFVWGNLKISINVVYNAIWQGGLGMIETESYLDAIKVCLFRKSINNNDFWAKEIQQYRISPDFPFHLKM